MDPRDIARYRSQFLANPPAFVEGVRGFCKQAGMSETWDSLKLPLFLALLAYGGLKAGSAWGRYANRTQNPNGPVKGPFMKLVEGALPEGQKVVWPGQPGYAAEQSRRAAEYLSKRKERFGDIPWADPAAKARVEAMASGGL